jgi:hypothetical protein
MKLQSGQTRVIPLIRRASTALHVTDSHWEVAVDVADVVGGGRWPRTARKHY